MRLLLGKIFAVALVLGALLFDYVLLDVALAADDAWKICAPMAIVISVLSFLLASDAWDSGLG